MRKMFARSAFNNRRTGWLRRFRGLVTLASTTVLILLIALPIQAVTHTIELPFDVIGGNPGDAILLHSETIPSPMVGQVCSVTAGGENNFSVHPGNNIEITSANTVTLVGVEDYAGKVTTASGELTLGEEITVTLLLAPDGDGAYSAALDIVLDCQAATTTTTTTQPTTTTTTEATTTTQLPTGVTESTANSTESMVSDEVMGTQITNTTPPDEVEALEVLPFTGSEGAGLLMLAASVIMLGGVFLISARREEG